MTPPLRSDARRNRERIVAAASELFAEHGVDLCVDEIARRAGVGHATVFRRFPTKDDLIVAMFERRLDEVGEAVEEAARADDPWEGLVAAMAFIAERQARDRGMFEAAGSEVVGSPRMRDARARILAPLTDLLRRAQAAGAVREDLEPQDMIFLITAAGRASPCRLEIGDLWRRYLGVILDGMRPFAARPLPVPAPGVDEVESALEAASAAGARASSA